MTSEELKDYLYEHIPLTRAMEVEVVSVAQESVVLRAPLAPNINHRETVFGGSASAVAILAAWSLVHTRLASAGIPSRIVIQRNRMEYLRPIAGTFSAASYISPSDWARFLRMLERKGVGRITVRSTLLYEGDPAGEFEGEFVAGR